MRPSVATFLINYYRKENIVSKTYDTLVLFPGHPGPPVEDGVTEEEPAADADDDLDETNAVDDRGLDERNTGRSEQLYGADSALESLRENLKELSKHRAGTMKQQVVASGDLARPNVNKIKKQVKTIEQSIGALDSKVHRIDGKLHASARTERVKGGRKREAC